MTLAELQSRVAAALMSPLTGSDSIAPRSADGKKMRAEADELIKPNGRMTSLERLEIYSRSYWFRLLDALYDDFPGLAAVLGSRAFYRCVRAYLAACPSQSFTMRDLGSRLPTWLEAHPQFAGAAPALAVDMARLEWAHVVAYDGPEARPLGPEGLLEPGPELKLTLQPHLTLLSLRYPVDDFRIEATRSRGAASNAVGDYQRRSPGPRFRRTRSQPVYVAVYRRDCSVYYRRLDREEFLVLEALRAGQPIGEALEVCSEDLGPKVEQWFAAWSELGWLCALEETTNA
jgi:hypothetical protein